MTTGRRMQKDPFDLVVEGSKVSKWPFVGRVVNDGDDDVGLLRALWRRWHLSTLLPSEGTWQGRRR